MTAQKAAAKVAPTARPAPRTTAEAAQAMADLGAAMAERAKLQAALDAEVAQISARFQQSMRPLVEAEDAIFAGLHEWAEANRETLGDSANLGTGEVGWKKSPEKLVVEDEEKVIEALRKKELTEFVRVKESLDKVLLKKRFGEVKGIKGLTLVQEEVFRAKPAGLNMEKLAS